MTKYCKNCGTKNLESSEFCSECGIKLENKPKTTSPQKSKNLKIVIGLLVVIVLLLCVILAMIMSVPNSEMLLETQDFGGVSMLTPVGSDFIETTSSPSIGTVGGFVLFENGGEYSHDVFSITFSTLSTKSHLSDVVLDHREGDIVIYKDKNGGDGYFIQREVDGVTIDIIGSNKDVIVKMLNSVEVDPNFS